jgi:hypothetical protein
MGDDEENFSFIGIVLVGVKAQVEVGFGDEIFIFRASSGKEKTGGRFPRSEGFPLEVVALLIEEAEDMLLSDEAGEDGSFEIGSGFCGFGWESWG